MKKKIAKSKRKASARQPRQGVSSSIALVQPSATEVFHALELELAEAMETAQRKADEYAKNKDYDGASRQQERAYCLATLSCSMGVRSKNALMQRGFVDRWLNDRTERRGQ